MTEIFHRTLLQQQLIGAFNTFILLNVIKHYLEISLDVG